MAVLCVLLACLAAPCGAAPLPSAVQLTELVFPGWNDSHTGRMQSMTLPVGFGASHPNWGSGTVRVIVQPKLVMKTDNDRATLVLAILPVGEDGKPQVAHLTPLGLAAYQFERAGTDWQVAGRQGIFAWRGFFGAATVRPVVLAEGRKPRQALAVEYGSCWDGYCGTWLALYELDRGVLRREPAVELTLTGTNVDSTADCMRRLQPLITPHTPDPVPRDDGAAEAHDCYMIDGGWNIEPSRDQPGDLVIRYQGAMSRADAAAAPPSAIDQRQVLHYGSGKYRAVAGFNPVPPI
jgi:hypothetical protein